MGRSRGNFHADEDPSQRSRRKKNALSGENLDSSTPGQGSSEGKRALYHCNYCNKDISGRTRIKCTVCSDFDLCIECFSVGAEVHPHKSCHPYRVMDILSFPIICPEWNADEEILLLEGIEMYGVGNWAEVAEHVGTKSKVACIEHYRAAYLSSPCFPLPDMTHANGKNRKELLAMAKGQLEDKKEVQLKEESPFSPSRVKVEDTYKNGPSSRIAATSMPGAKVNKKASNNFHSKDQEELQKVEDNASGRSFIGSKPKATRLETPMVDSSGYNPKRQEFDPEYDNDAEQLLADMEFKENDTEDERKLKLRVLRIYGKRLDERKRRKEFILERDLLLPSQFRKDLSREEKELCQRYDVYMRFHSKADHEELIKVVISEHRIQKRIQQLEEARAMGCRSAADADRYLEQKRRKSVNATHPNDSTQPILSSQDSLLPFYPESLGAYPTPTSGGQALLLGQNDPENLSDSGANLLSEYEKQLCREMKLSPNLYLKMQEDMTTQIMSGGITKKSEAHSFFQLEPSKVDRVYDMLLKKGIVQQP